MWAHTTGPKSLRKVTNEVALARHGLTLGEDRAAAFRKVLEYLPGHPGLAFGPEITPKIKMREINKIC